MVTRWAVRPISTRVSLLAIVVGALFACAALLVPPATAPASAPAAQDRSETPAARVSSGAQLGPRQCAQRIAGLTDRRKLAQLLMVGVNDTAPDEALRAVRAEGIGGIFLGGSSTALLTDGMLAAIAAESTLPLTIAVDDEGGRVQRVDELDGSLPSARVMAATMTEDEVRTMAADRARAMLARGITMDFAPVADIGSQNRREVIGDRSFGADPQRATGYVGAFAAGLRDGGMLPVLKHFPGHGNAVGDTHKNSVRAPHLDSLREVDLVPYRELPRKGLVAVMFGHMEVPGLTDGAPASLHPAAYRLLREEFRFDGLTITDDLGGMKAVSARYDLPDAVLGALKAGVDVAFWSSGQRLGEVLDRLELAVRTGELSAQRVTDALERALMSRSACGKPRSAR